MEQHELTRSVINFTYEKLLRDAKITLLYNLSKKTEFSFENLVSRYMKDYPSNEKCHIVFLYQHNGEHNGEHNEHDIYVNSGGYIFDGNKIKGIVCNETPILF